MPADNTVDASKRTFRILEELYENDSMRVTDLAAELDLPKSTIHNHLSTLKESGYVVKEHEKYKIGLQFLKLGEYARSRKDIYKKGRPEVDKLAQKTGELANLATIEYGQGVYLYLRVGEQGVDLDTYAGMPFHLHCTALGKAILAHLPRERVEEILDTRGLPERTDNTITDRETLYDDLETIRERGYAVDKAERLEGLRCVAAPIQDVDNNILGSISVSGPTSRMKDHRFEEEIPEAVLDAANVIELSIKYT